MIARVSGDARQPFGDENPSFTFLDVFDLIADDGHDPDKVMWGLWCLEDPASPHYGKPRADRRKTAQKWIKDVPDELIEKYAKMYVDECMPPSMRRYARLTEMYEIIFDSAYEVLTQKTKVVEVKGEDGSITTNEVAAELNLAPAQQIMKESKSYAINLDAARKLAEEEWVSEAREPEEGVKRKTKLSTQAKPGMFARLSMEGRKAKGKKTGT